MNNAVFRKIIENVRNLRNIEFITSKARMNYLVLEPNYYTTTFFSKKKQQKHTHTHTNIHNSLVYLGLSILEISKIVIYQFWYEYIGMIGIYVTWIQTPL